jgi:hypothetical protein
MPEAKHRRKGKTRERLPPTQGTAKYRRDAFGDWLCLLTERGDRVTERCQQLYGPRPDDDYTDEQWTAAERQLEDEGILPRPDSKDDLP